MVKDRLPELEAVNELHTDIELLENDVNTIDKLQKDILATPQRDSELELEEDDKLLSGTTANVTFSEDEVEKMLEKNHPGIFTQAIMAETEAAKRSLSDIEARHADIIRLEKSIQEMRELFFNVALLVEQQVICLR
ncbi:unnamed protein product [Trichobilharzia regenti]|nr:unnamed protein product [Trichobilharzia regenti]